MTRKKSLSIIFTNCIIISLLFSFGACTNSKELNILIPYEINGKTGFVNQYLKKLTDAEYDSYERSTLVVGKYCANVKKTTDNNMYVMLHTGELVKDSSDSHFASIIGDEYYAFEHSNPVGTTLYSSVNKRIKYTYEGVSFRSVRPCKDVHNIPIFYRDDMGSHNGFMNIDGTKKKVANEFNRAFSYDERYGMGIVTDAGFANRIINEKGEYISKELRLSVGSFSCGMVAGQLIWESGQGYFDHTGKLAIEVAEIEEELAYGFHCNVLPCILEDGKVYVVHYKQSDNKAIQSNNWAIIDKTGKPVKENIEALSILEFSDDGVAVLYKNENGKTKCYLIDTEGNFIVDTPYDKIRTSINGYCMAIKDGIDYLVSAKDGSAYKCLDFK